jgi:hypothetical protein
MSFVRNPDGSDCIGASLKKAKMFRADMAYALKLGVDEFEREAITREIGGKKWRLHKNVNLYIDTTAKCPFNCGFCIAKTLDGRGAEFVSVEKVKAIIAELEKAEVFFTCQITGGEPTLHPRIDELRAICGKRKTVINTNFPSAALASFNHVNVSCHHYNRIIEAGIMGGDRDREALSYGIGGIRDKIRLQCNIIGGKVDTFGEVAQYIAWGYHALGITNYAFSFLTALPSNGFYSDGIIEYVKDRPAISFNEIVSEFEKRDHFRFKKYRGGVACYYEIWEYTAYENPITIVIKYSDNHVLHALDSSPDLVPDMIIHPNGTLTASWDSRIKRML